MPIHTHDVYLWQVLLKSPPYVVSREIGVNGQTDGSENILLLPWTLGRQRKIRLWKNARA